jgi:hypothetical protein
MSDNVIMSVAIDTCVSDVYQRLPPYWYSLAGEGMEILACLFGTRECRTCAPFCLLKAKSMGDDTASAAKEVGETKTPDEKVETAQQYETLEKIHQRAWRVIPRVLGMKLVRSRVLTRKLRLSQHETLEKIH